MKTKNTKQLKDLRGCDIVCFAQDWTGDPLSKTHLMRILARDNRILWVNSIGLRGPSLSKADASRAFQKIASSMTPIKEVEPNLFVMSPFTIPAYGNKVLRFINQQSLLFQVRKAMRKLGFKHSVNYSFLPSAALLAGKLDEDMIIYHCVDEYAAFSDIESKPILDLEEALLKKSDVVIVSADALYESKIKHNANTHLVRHGVDFTHFRKALDSDTKIPEEIVDLPHPVIGFFGLIADWVDIELMAKVARHFSHGSMVVVGKTTTDVSSLKKLPNVHLLGRKPYADLPRYCKGFDVALNPFVINELTISANPLKVREYLAAGLEVVSTDIPEVRRLDNCRIGETHEDYIRQIEEVLNNSKPRTQISDSVKSESWETRVDEVREILRGKEFLEQAAKG
jgi:glycosyltransferase involved in cell wall biosynthesis